MSTTLGVSILLLVLCLVAISGWYLLIQNPSNYSTSWSSIQKEEFWEHRIRAVGGEKAYQELISVNQSVPFLKGHTEAHIFGKALYVVEGIPGIVVCDDKFLSGCSHEFLSTAVQEGGIGVIPSLNKECAAYASSAVDRVRCQHGIGHGVLGILGYTEKELLKSLEVCSMLDHSNVLSVSACSSGVFMEYNQRFLLAEDRVVRPIKNGDLFYPCFDVLEQDRSVCVSITRMVGRSLI